MDTGLLPYRRSTATPRIRLYCLPFAGGSAAAYLGWADRLPPDVELCPLQLPGRGARADEPPRTRIAELSAEIAHGIADERYRLPFVLFGHSMGGLLAYETTQMLRDRGGPEPRRLVVSSARSPDRWNRLRTSSHLGSDAALTTMLRAQGGTPPEFFDHPDLVARAIPILRADLEACERYRYAERPPLTVPIDVLGGRDDPEVDEADLLGWRRHSTAPSSLHVFDGGHFYQESSTDAMFTVLTAVLSGICLPRHSSS
ncbi:alpha/beta fold hydrolase [Micromonospora sp. WMMA1998]|uniref:thioesterase II family protein n=1 Tax=Micromonospora sp. WMMA1998 TaxID=3015167 RepID=UPI00248CBE5D|nr:alpha/beta fold hydrolase [Micromonospora sp. WMMA1998]WBC16752.1 alpha/beta fold hydrolase [Micromonospora sp. WMMA1998]